MATGIGDAKKELAVNSAMAQLDKSIAELNQLTSNLCERTVLVRRCETENASIAKAEGRPQSTVPLVAQLDDFRIRLNDIRYRIGNTLDQLEI